MTGSYGPSVTSFGKMNGVPSAALHADRKRPGRGGFARSGELLHQVAPPRLPRARVTGAGRGCRRVIQGRAYERPAPRAYLSRARRLARLIPPRPRPRVPPPAAPVARLPASALPANRHPVIRQHARARPRRQHVRLPRRLLRRHVHGDSPRLPQSHHQGSRPDHPPCPPRDGVPPRGDHRSRDATRAVSDPTRRVRRLTCMPIDAHRLPRRTTPIRAATPPPSPPFSARTTCSPTRRSARDTTRRARTRRRWRRNSWKISEGARFATEASRARFEPRPSRTPSSRRRRTRARTPPGSRRGCARGCVDAAARERNPPTVRNQKKMRF